MRINTISVFYTVPSPARHLESLCYVNKGLAVEFFSQRVPEELAANGLLRDVFLLDYGGFREAFVNVCGVLQEGAGHDHGSVEVALVTDDSLAEVAVVHHADGRENHHYAEGHQAQAGDRCFEIAAEHLRKALVDVTEPVVEGTLLALGQFVFHVSQFDEDVVEVVEALAQGLEESISGVWSSASEDIFPFIVANEVVEQEAAEKAVLGVGNEALDLLGCAGEDAADAGLVDADKLAVLAADV